MVTKTSAQLKAELIDLFYGIDPATLLVESVTVTRGGTLTLRRAGKPPSVYRIRGGKPALGEIVRVFGLSELISLSPVSAHDDVDVEHPAVTGLKQVAVKKRQRRDEDALNARRTGDDAGEG